MLNDMLNEETEGEESLWMLLHLLWMGPVALVTFLSGIMIFLFFVVLIGLLLGTFGYICLMALGVV